MAVYAKAEGGYTPTGTPVKTRPRTYVDEMTFGTMGLARAKFDQRQSDLLAPQAATPP